MFFVLSDPDRCEYCRPAVSPNADRECLTGVCVCVCPLSGLSLSVPSSQQLYNNFKKNTTYCVLHSCKVEFTVNISCGDGPENNRLCQPHCGKYV